MSDFEPIPEWSSTLTLEQAAEPLSIDLIRRVRDRLLNEPVHLEPPMMILPMGSHGHKQNARLRRTVTDGGMTIVLKEHVSPHMYWWRRMNGKTVGEAMSL